MASHQENLSLVDLYSEGDDPLKKLYPMVDESDTPLPRYWSTKDKFHLIGLSENNLRVHYKGQGKFGKDAASVRANHPIPPLCGLYYFEVKIHSKGRDGHMGIGLSIQGINSNRLPGWDENTYGYHGDDGHSFSCSDVGRPYGPTFTTGDIIGCGVNLVDNVCFYTKNGHYLGVAFTDLVDDFLYPTVGLQTPGEVIDANFGQSPFVFDFGEMILELRHKIASCIHQIPIGVTKGEWHVILHTLVASYLSHHGYCDSAEAFIKSVDIPLEEDLASIRNRQRIQTLVLSGHIEEAIKDVQDLYPGFFEKNQNLLFRLKVRQFIELVNGTSSRVQENNQTPSALCKSSSLPISSFANGKPDDVQAMDGSVQHTSVIQSTKNVISKQSEMTTAEALNLQNALHNATSSPNGISSIIEPSNLSLTSSVTTSSSSISHPGDSDSEMECAEGPLFDSSENKANGITNGFVDDMLETGTDMDDEDMEIENENNYQKMPVLSKCNVESMLAFGRDVQLMSRRLRQEFGENEENRKVLRDAFSLLAYNDPWSSSVGWQLDPLQREHIYQELNSALLESHQKPRRPAVETCYNHTKKLMTLMTQSALGSCAFTSLEAVVGCDFPLAVPKPKYPAISSLAP